MDLPHLERQQHAAQNGSRHARTVSRVSAIEAQDASYGTVVRPA
jgi:hypothetical protein